MFTLDNYFYPYCDTSKVESVPLIQRACLNQKNESRNKTNYWKNKYLKGLNGNDQMVGHSGDIHGTSVIHVC